MSIQAGSPVSMVGGAGTEVGGAGMREVWACARAQPIARMPAEKAGSH